MILSFGHILDDEVYKKDVILVNGRYSIFNNIVSDTVRQKYTVIEQGENSDFMSEFSSDFEFGNAGSDDTFGTDSIEDFMDLNKVPSVLGKRVCIVDYSMMTKKQIEWLNRYIKKPSKFGVLVVIINDFRVATKYRKSKAIVKSENIAMLNLSFPNRTALKKIIKANLSEYNIEERALELFIWRLSDNYEMYQTAFEQVKLYQGDVITYDTMKNLLVGIDNYNIDDFIKMLLKPPKNRNGRPRNIYKALKCLMDDMGAKALVGKVKTAIDRVSEMRIQMNLGNISAGSGFVLSEKALNEFKERLEDDNILKGMANFTLSKYYKLAKMTSARDLMFMQMILDNNRVDKFSTEGYERVLYSLINRQTFRSTRVQNDAGMDDILSRGLYDINVTSLGN